MCDSDIDKLNNTYLRALAERTFLIDDVIICDNANTIGVGSKINVPVMKIKRKHWFFVGKFSAFSVVLFHRQISDLSWVRYLYDGG